MAKGKDEKKGQKQEPSSTTSLGKRRSLGSNKEKKRRAANAAAAALNEQSTASKHHQHHHHQHNKHQQGRASDSGSGRNQTTSTMSNPKTSEYGSQASPLRVPATPKELTKVAIIGGAGGIGQPLALLLMLHSEYVQHLALFDLVDSTRGVGIDLSHVDRQCKVTTHVGQEELADAVRGARVVVVPAGLAQKPGMSRDDLFGSNAKILYNIAKVCAQVAPEAMLAIITNPVNSLVPIACEVYSRYSSGAQHQMPPSSTTSDEQQQQPDLKATKSEGAAAAAATAVGPPKLQFIDCFRRIFGVTTLDVVRASTLTAKSALFKSEPNGLFKDPAKIHLPVVGGHAGRTIMPLLSQATPKLDKKRLLEDKATTFTLIESIQQAGIEVLNAKRGKGSATLAMAYAACRFTISLLRAQLGEQNIVECAYVRHSSPAYADLEYFATPLLLGRDGYVKSMGVGKVLGFEEQMLQEGARELRSSIAKGEDFARENLSAEK